MHPYFDVPLPQLFAHRGASAEAPENTLAAFDRAVELGVPFLETDCHATRDGVIVLCHDADVSRTTDGRGPIPALTYAEIQALDAGYRFRPDSERGASESAPFPFRGRGLHIPRLSALLERHPRARINLELKGEDPALAARVVSVVREHGACERVLLAASSHVVLEAVRALDPGTALGSSLQDVIEFFAALDAGRIDQHRPRGQALQIPRRAQGRELVTRPALEAAEHLGLRVHVWTIDDPDEMRTLLDRGVHGLMSNDPGRLKKIADSRARLRSADTER